MFSRETAKVIIEGTSLQKAESCMMKLTTALKGALLADSLALGPHWIYDTSKIENKFGRVDQFYQPDDESYHRGQPLGGQTHYGHQAVVLAQSVTQKWSIESFRNQLTAFWESSDSYKDKATKNFQQGQEGASDELGGATRFVAIVGAIEDRTKAVQMSREQCSLTHSAVVEAVAEQFLDLAFRLVDSENLREAVPAVFNGSPHYRRAQSVGHLPPTPAIKELGQGCSLNSALPAVLYFLLRAEDYRETLIDNVMAGGDSASRGLPLGGLLALAYGDSSLPPSWLEASLVCSKMADS